MKTFTKTNDFIEAGNHITEFTYRHHDGYICNILRAKPKAKFLKYFKPEDAGYMWTVEDYHLIDNPQGARVRNFEAAKSQRLLILALMNEMEKTGDLK